MGKRRQLARRTVKQRDDHDGPRQIATQKSSATRAKAIDDKRASSMIKAGTGRIKATAES